jgi:hypothetical protein
MLRNNKFASYSVSNSVRQQPKQRMLKESLGDDAQGLTQTYEWFKFQKRINVSR